MKNAVQSLLVVVLVLATPALFAQMHMGGAGVAGGARMGGPGVVSGVHPSGGFGHGGFQFGRGFGVKPLPRGVIGGFPVFGRGFHNNRFFSPFWTNGYWWGDGFYPDQGEQQVIVQQPGNPVVVQAAPQPVQEVKPANPLLIELQDGRFVRLTGNEVNPPASPAGTVQTSANSQQDQLPPAVLIFRDGHQQEVSSYSIIGPALYVSGSYWTNGYWTQKILLADLNLPATIQANQERGVNFVLPSAPNQVVTRP